MVPRSRRRRSSVVEHVLGKDGVRCSIHRGGTTVTHQEQRLDRLARKGQMPAQSAAQFDVELPTAGSRVDDRRAYALAPAASRLSPARSGSAIGSLRSADKSAEI